MLVWIVSAWSNKDQIREIQFIELTYEKALADVQSNRSGFEDCCYGMCCIEAYQTDSYLGMIGEELINCCKYSKKCRELEFAPAFTTQYFKFNDEKKCWEEAK